MVATRMAALVGGLLPVSLVLNDAVAQPAAELQKPRITIFDFRVVGEVGIPDAGLVVADLLYPGFSAGVYRIVERGTLLALLKDANIDLAAVVDDPSLLRELKIEGVDFVLVGNVVKLHNIVISARIVNVRTAEVQVAAKVSLPDAGGLEAAVKDLAVRLQQDEVSWARTQRINELLTLAKANDSKQTGKTALDALDELLRLDPAHREALALREKIRAYYGPPPILELDLGNDVKLELVLIPAGRFHMGSPAREQHRESREGLQQRVTIAKPFYMGKFEVTQAQWQAVMGNNPSRHRGAKLPVENVSWEDCQKFVLSLSTLVGREVRLPTEAEWEYACRAGTTTPFHFGKDLDSTMANFLGGFPYGAGAKGANRGRTTEVGSFQPNAWGLYDMHGNVSEWCEDEWAESLIIVPTGGSAVVGTGLLAHVVRGGAFSVIGRNCRSAVRFRFTPSSRSDSLGFRVVVSAQ